MNVRGAIQRPLPWPTAALCAAFVFFFAYLGIASVLQFFFLPANPETVASLNNSAPIPKQTLLYGAASMAMSFPVAQATYTALRGERVREALIESSVEFLKVGTVCVVWVVAFLSLLWAGGLNDVAGTIGTALLLVFILLSLVVFGKFYGKHTPPYPDSKDGEANE